MEELDDKKIDIKKQYSGTAYQIKILLLLLCRGKKVKDYEHFYLRTEVKEAEKFDDALFYYKKKGEEIFNVRYCQIKNSEKEDAELRYSDFVSDYDKAVANIKKYFISYRKIKLTTVKENVDDFILCTSYKVPLVLKKNEEAKANETLILEENNTYDKLFGDVTDQWKRYKIMQISSELQNSLMKTTNLDLLAEALTECVIKSIQQKSWDVTIDFVNIWLFMYQPALEEEKVIVKKENTKKCVGKKNDVFVFSEDFLKNISISKECQNFRKIFLNHCGAKFMNLFFRDRIFNVDDYFNDLMITSKKEFKNQPSDNDASLSDGINVEQFARHFCESVFYNELLTSDIFVQNTTSAKNFLKKVFKSVGTKVVKFSGDFVQNMQLSDDVRLFREYFITSYAVMELEMVKLKLVQNKCKSIFGSDNEKYNFCCRKLINTDNINAEIKTFFETFTIQTLPHHKDLLKVIKREIGEEFLDEKWVTNSLIEKVEQWFKTSNEAPFDKAQIIKFYDEVKQDFVIQMIEKNFYVQMLNSFNISFNTSTASLQNLTKALSEEYKEDQPQTHQFICFITSKEPILTAIKVKNSVLSLKHFMTQKSFIMAPASVWLQMENEANSLMNALISNNCYKLIIVIDDNETATMTLFKFHLNAFKKQIILITTKPSAAYKNIKKTYVVEEEIEDHFHFEELTKASQEYLKNKQVIFQGKSVSLSKIINSAFHLIDAKTVMKIVSNSTIEVSGMLNPYKEYDKKTYVERKIGLIKMNERFYYSYNHFSYCLFLIETQNITEAFQFLKDKKIAKHRICSKIENWSFNSPFLTANSEDAKREFQKMCIKQANSQIYWFLLKNHNLYWFHCTANALVDDSYLKPFKYIETCYEDEMEALPFLSNLKIVIVTDAPGMGKSTILTNLSQRIPDNLVKWQVRIDLNKYTKQLLELKEKQSKNDNDYKDIGKYVIYKISDRISSNTEKPFEICVFDEMFRQNNILFIFDGFDEICPDYENEVIEIFQKIQVSSKNLLWITSRLNKKEILERKLKTIAFTIMPFTVKDQKEFLTKFWKKNWKQEWNNIYERHLQTYIEYLITEFNAMTKRNDTDIIGIPLQTKMLADVFEQNEVEEENWNSCFKFLNNTKDCDDQKCRCSPLLRNKLQNLFVLYEAFVKKHITRYLIEKKEYDNTKVGWDSTEILYYNEINNIHKLLGMFALIDDATLNKLLTSAECETKKLWVSRIKTGEASFGLISHVSDDNKPLFTHFTFAEFFAANYLIDKMISEPFKVFQLVDLILQSDVPVFLYCLKNQIKINVCVEKLERALGNTTVINFSAKHGFSNCYKYFTMNDNFEHIFPKSDKFGKTPLHYAADFNNIKCVVLILLQKYNGLLKASRTLNEKNWEKSLMQLESEESIRVEDKRILFFLKEFITVPDENGKSALDYCKSPEISEMLNDFMEIGKKNLILKKVIRFEISHIHWIKSKLEILETFDGTEPQFLLIYILYSCSLKTIIIFLDNCELLSYAIILKNKKLYDIISGRLDICEPEKISFFNNLIGKIPEKRQEIGDIILQSSIIHANTEVFQYFFQHERIHLFSQINSYFKIACEINYIELVEIMLQNYPKIENADLSYILEPVEANITILKRIFQHFQGVFGEERYAGKILQNEFEKPNPSIEIVKFLLSKGADKYVTTVCKKNVFHYAININNDDDILQAISYILDPKVKNFIEKFYDDKSQNKKFNYFKAFEINDEKLCTFFIRKCTNVNMKDENGKSLLCYACEKGWKNVTKLLLKSGACYEDVYDENGVLFDYCQKNKDIATLLTKVKRHFETTEFCTFTKDSHVSLKTVNKNNVPLWLVIARAGKENNMMETFHKTINYGYINSQDSKGNTALHLAAKGGFYKILRDLLEKGAYYNVENHNNEKPQYLAGTKDIITIFTKLDKLFEAIKNNEILTKTEEFFYQVQDSSGRTILHYAVINGFYDNVERIFNVIKSSENIINIKDVNHKTSLYYAIKNNNVDILKILFQNGTKLDRKECYEMIEENECTSFIKLMNQLFININNQHIDAFFYTMKCLSKISSFDTYDIFNIKNDTGQSLFQKAEELNCYPLIIFMMENGAIVDLSKTNNSKRKKFENIKSLIRKIFDAIYQGRYQTSSIIRLIEKNNLTKIILAIRESKLHNTLLHISLEAGNLKMVKWLHKNGADFSAKNIHGITPLQLLQDTNNKVSPTHKTFDHATYTEAEISNIIDSRLKEKTSNQDSEESGPDETFNCIPTLPPPSARCRNTNTLPQLLVEPYIPTKNKNISNQWSPAVNPPSSVFTTCHSSIVQQSHGVPPIVSHVQNPYFTAAGFNHNPIYPNIQNSPFTQTHYPVPQQVQNNVHLPINHSPSVYAYNIPTIQHHQYLYQPEQIQLQPYPVYYPLYFNTILSVYTFYPSNFNELPTAYVMSPYPIYNCPNPCYPNPCWP